MTTSGNKNQKMCLTQIQRKDAYNQHQIMKISNRRI